jgi:hypothetical protein
LYRPGDVRFEALLPQIIKPTDAIIRISATCVCGSDWGELYPFADRLALESAKRLRIPATAQELARLTQQEQFPRLLAVQLAGRAHAEIREQAVLEEK